ncbi:hypothetical protein K2Q16_01610 [Patescibacteria group bacterium]|nr:hypothetical protein [Patescibacteria group bacterium]
MDGVIVGSVLGAALTYWGGRALWHGEKIASTAVVETLLVALYLTMLVAYAGLRMPVFAHRSPFWSTFWLIMFAGHSSLLFDSFAVVLLLATGIVFLPLPGSSERYNQFFVKVAASFAALTVGGGFYLGELWGLPWYISNNLAEPLVGFPLLLVLTPACACLAYITARFHPVKMEPVVMDRSQVMAAAEFVVGLLLIIVTHSPVLCIGVLCIYTAVRSMTTQLVERTAHEFTSGAQNALGLILAAVAVQGSGLSSYVEPYLQGWGMFVGAAISSPFAGAMAPPVDNLHDFYVGLSMLMAGAPLFVFSSLVAIVVFTGRLEHEDLPPYMQRVISLWGARKSAVYVEEAVAYTLLVLPMVAVLGVMLTLANYYGVFMAGADFLGVTMK